MMKPNAAASMITCWPASLPGERILCIRCQQHPRYHTARLVYDYCQPCYYQIQRAAECRRVASKYRSLSIRSTAT